MISNDVGEGGLRRDASNQAQLPAVLAPPVENAPAVFGHSRIYFLISRLRAHPGPGRISQDSFESLEKTLHGDNMYSFVFTS